MGHVYFGRETIPVHTPKPAWTGMVEQHVDKRKVYFMEHKMSEGDDR